MLQSTPDNHSFSDKFDCSIIDTCAGDKGSFGAGNCGACHVTVNYRVGRKVQAPGKKSEVEDEDEDEHEGLGWKRVRDARRGSKNFFIATSTTGDHCDTSATC
jgi:hypothetical protein